MKVLPSTLRSIILASVVSSTSIHVAAQRPVPNELRFLKGEDTDGCDAGAALGIGTIFAQAAEGIARQPEAEGKIMRASVIGAVLARSACEPIEDIVNDDFVAALDKVYQYYGVV